jgi:hypothetical protein
MSASLASRDVALFCETVTRPAPEFRPLAVLPILATQSAELEQLVTISAWGDDSANLAALRSDLRSASEILSRAVQHAAAWQDERVA